MSASSVRYSVGDELDPLVIGEITKELIAEYSRVSHDPNPMHTDEELARSAGHPTVFAQGMLGMAFLARHLKVSGAFSNAWLTIFGGKYAILPLTLAPCFLQISKASSLWNTTPVSSRICMDAA